MPVSFANLVWDEGSENLGGALGSVFYLPGSAADISALTCTDGVTLIGDVGLAGTQVAVEVYATEDSIDLLDAQQGEFDGENTLNTLSFFHPGSKKEQAAFKRKVTVVPGIWFVKDSDLNWRVVGLTALQTQVGTYKVTKDIQARVTAKEGTHGKRADTRKGTLYTVSYVCPHESMFYSGEIPLAAAPLANAAAKKGT